jgi:hypothetical protein
MPMNRFILCVSGDLTGVIKTARFKVPLSILKQAWDNIFFEYIDLTKSPSNQRLLSIMKELTALEVEKNIITQSLAVLKYKTNQRIVDNIKKLGYSFNSDEYTKSSKKLLSQFKTKDLRIQELKEELAKSESNAAKSNEEQELNYHALFAEFSKFQGYRLDPKDITVSEYIAILNSYQAETKQKTAHGRR